MPHTKFDVFVSHNSLDKPAVEVIHGLLERGDPERGERPIPCWFDKDDLRSAGTWVSQLEDAVATCGAAVVFFGPDGHGPVHKYEIDLLLKRAMYEQGRDAIRLVLVLLPGAQESAIQGFISLQMWADFRKGTDDAAALQRLRAFVLGEAPPSGPGDDPLTPKPEIEPYRGLEAFERKHAGYFFGRDNEIKELCGRLHEWPFTAVIGGSGSGKSSVVRAGLRTDLAKKERPTFAETTIITVRPGTNPIHALAEQVATTLSDLPADERLKIVEVLDARFRSYSDALLNSLTSIFTRDDQHVLLVIDQFEELFTHSSNNRPAEPSGPASPTSDLQQTQFVELLAAVAKSQLDRLRILITLRADFFDRCLSLPTLKSLIENRTLLLGKLSDDALRTVIEAPAFQVGAYFEKGLVARILKDVENQNGSLPLLQHALKELWVKRRFGFLTVDSYNETGGVEGALKKRANAVFQNLSEVQREIAKNIFLRLTTLGEGVSDTRRRVGKNELYPEKTDPSLIDAVLKVLSSQGNRLIVINDDSTVEVTHEALIQRWDTLICWIAENRDDKRQHDRLRDAASDWAKSRAERGKHDPSLLYTGKRLAEAKDWANKSRTGLSKRERLFIDASKNADYRKKGGVGLIVATLVCGVMAGVYFDHQRNRQQQTHDLVESLLNPAAGSVEPYLKQLEPFRDLATKDLHRELLNKKRDRIQRVHAAYGLIRFGQEDFAVIEVLLDSMPTLPKDEDKNLVRALARVPPTMHLGDLLGKHLDNVKSDSARNRFLAAELSLGITDKTAAVCKLKADPTSRTSLILEFKEFPGDLASIVGVLEVTQDPELRSALCVAIGTLGTEANDATQTTLKRLFAEATDGGTHGACDWALRQQGLTEDELLKLVQTPQSGTTNPVRDWEINKLNMTMLKIPARDFAMGSVEDNENPSGYVPVEKFDAFWMSDREVSVGQFRAVLTDGRKQAQIGNPQLPMNRVSWFDAIEFCNALSKRHELIPYYHLDKISRRDDDSIESAEVTEAGGHGYRLPNEKEWEYACRALSTTDYSFGRDTSWLEDFAVNEQGTAQVGGTKPPNGFGLFDMHGNVDEWCWDKRNNQSDSRVLRGGSFYLDPECLRSANHAGGSAGVPSFDRGFRVSRTP